MQLKALFLYYLLLHAGSIAFSQAFESSTAVADSVAPKTPFISNAGLDLSFGPIFGMHPNLRNAYPKGYYFVEGKASAVVMGLPFKLAFRQSDEALRFGRASYFKLSFDAAAYNKQNLAKLSHEIDGIHSEISQQQKLLYALQAKWGYLYQKKMELDAKLKQEALDPSFKLNIPAMEKPDSLALPQLPTVPAVNVPNLPTPKLPDMDSLSKAIEGVETNLGNLKNQQLALKADYAQAKSKIPLDFLSGIRKMDFGLTSLGKSSMSRNAVPIRGVHVQYAGERYFTDVAAGYTLPNQLFSNQAFDQVLYNSGNIFNMGDYFQVNNVRFVSSAKVGYGKETGNFIAAENYYSGGALHPADGVDAAPKSLTSNLSTRLSPSKWKNFSWQNTVGITWATSPDSVPVKTADRIALFSSAALQMPKLKSSIEGSYRRIPSHFDGSTQGIYLKQTERIEVIYKQAVTRNLKTAFRLMRDLFFLQNALQSSRLIHQANVDLQLKLSSRFVMTGNYSLLQLRERAVEVSPRSDLSHLARLGCVSTHQIAKNEFTTLHEVSYAAINGFDSVQTLTQATARYSYQVQQWRFGLQAQYSDFTGLTRLYGRNLIVQPEIGLKLEHFSFSASLQKLWSKQFDQDYGMQFKTSFAFSEYVDCDFMMQRFLPTEYALFIDPSLEYQKPFYLKFGLNVHL